MDKPRVLVEMTSNALRAMTLMAEAEQVPLDYWTGRGFTWLTVYTWEFGTAAPGFWELCECDFHEAEMLAIGANRRPRSVAVQVLGDDGTHATAFAVCQECLSRMGHSREGVPRVHAR